MKSLIFTFFLTAVSLCAAPVDPVCSYFTVSQHNAKPGKAVTLTINLRNDLNRPEKAKNIVLKINSPAVKVISAPAPVPGKAGVYTATISADNNAECDIAVVADGVVVEENVLTNPGFEHSTRGVPTGVSTYANHYDSTWFQYGSDYKKAQRQRHYLGCINFNKGKSIYWGFASVTGKNVLHNHRYIFSIMAKYNNIRGERGVTINTNQTNAQGKSLFHQYAGFRAGSSNGWVKVESEPQNIRKETASISCSAMILVAAGEVDFDNARLKLSPTVIWGNTPEGVCAPVSKPPRCLIPNYKRIDYAAAIRAEYLACKKLLDDAIAKYGTKSKLVQQFKADVARYTAKMVKTIHPRDAYNLQLEMEKRAAEFKKASAALAAGNLDAMLSDNTPAVPAPAAPAPAGPRFASSVQGGKAVKVSPSDVKIDGVLNDRAWKRATKLTHFRRTVNRKVVPEKTTVMTAYDDKNLYIAWDLPGRPEKLRAKNAHDDSTVFMDETIELFVTDPNSPMAYRQFVLTPGNVRWDALDRDRYINMKWQSATRIHSKGWCAEMAFPWSELNIDPARDKIIRINFCRSRHPEEAATKPDPRDFYESSAWSIITKGFHEINAFGFLTIGEPAQAFKDTTAAAIKKSQQFKNIPAVADALAKLKQGNPANIIDYQNRLCALEDAIKVSATNASAAQLSKVVRASSLLLSNWDEAVELEAARDFQIPLLASKLKKPDPAKLSYRMAVNEFAHKAFLISALKDAKNITLRPTALVGKSGIIPASQITCQRILFLTPDKDLWPGYYNTWSKRPLPELVEDIDEPFALEKYVSTQIRVLINSADAKPGKYTGKIAVRADGKTIGNIPVSCEVLPIVLPDSRSNPLWIYPFTQLPYPGKSGRAWAKLLRDHYVSDVSFETPRIYLNGKRLVPPPHIKDNKNYISKMVDPGIDFSGEIKIDGDFGDFAERLQICAEYGLKPVFSTRTEDIYPEVFPTFINFLQENGLAVDRFYYKTGDEDTSLWQYPLAEKLHKCAPQIPLYMIPSGSDYFDIKPLAKHYKYIAFTRAGLSNPAFEKDLRWMQKNGVKLARYTNRTSWAERDVRLAGRMDLWDVMINDRMDGYQVWTGSVTGEWLGYRYAYSSAARTPVHNYPPEKQSICQLVYVRKKGDFFKAISCIRLEDMRDGITDYLYYKEAEKALKARKDPNWEAKLAAVAKMPKKRPADYLAIRNALIKLILP